jgi:hypothetical protein
MSVLMIEKWEGLTAETYEKIREIAKWDTDPPKGFLFHVASFSDSAAHMVDVWESAEHFQNFVQERIMPAVQQVGLGGQPEVQIYPTHAILNPGKLT